MRHQTGVEASPQPICTLNPILQNALANLDVQLEDELARYRRLRLGGQVPQRQPRRRSPGHALDLISVPATGGRTNPASPARTTPPSPDFQHGIVEPPAHPGYPPRSDYPVAGNAAVSDLAIAVNHANHSLPESDLLTASTGDVDDLVKPYSQRLDDYLESSEELLKSLVEEETAVQAERGFMRSLLTPLGAGAMMLLLVSSAMFGYVLMNPNSLGRLFALRQGTTTGNSTVSATGGESPLTAKPEPDLAAQEFKDLNLDTLGTLEVNPRNRPNITPNPTISPAGNVPQLGAPGNPPTTASVPRLTETPGTPSASATVPVVPSDPGVNTNRSAAVKTVEPPYPAQLSPARSSAPAKPRSAPAPQSGNQSAAASTPTATSAAPTASATTGNTSYPYKIVTPYSGDRALEDARKINPDAYVTNFADGAYIQHGASNNEAEAQARAEALRSQGITVEVKHK